MGFVSYLKRWFGEGPSQPTAASRSKGLLHWYHVSFDDRSVRRRAEPPGRETWEDSLAWEDIVRVCFKTGDLFYSCDELYIFTHRRPESYLIPMEAEGATGLLDEIVRRGLFDAEVLIKAAQTTEEKLFCHPPADGASGDPEDA